ncbi:hypothetical protein A3H83_03010 [Candidatus Roizmanbacteria bacterium RIFCSPLOWO2_02_FULL_39_8]|nr:MAG: hypothetical protein A3H83_03010 [Candidatus Roizmanbacteria bacterium RIFCSPLOWO2_02_FULL_39_8]
MSDHFRLSLFTDQETGIAIALNKKIIPIKISMNPYGFIHKLQALKCRGKETSDILHTITSIFYLSINESDFIQYQRRAINSVISALQKSGSFKNTRIIVRTVMNIKNLSLENLESIKFAVEKNSQVRNEVYAIPDLLKFLSEEYAYKITI